jgi:hypothetical protein
MVKWCLYCEWGEYVTQQILPTPPGYGYETAPQLVFVSQPQKDEGGTIIAEAQGGGAKAYAVVSNGEIIDIVLYDQGSGYISPPRVYVTRNYQILKKGRNIETSLVTLDMSPNIIDARTLYITSGDIVGTPQPPILFISSFVVATPLESYRDITAILQKRVEVAISSNQRIVRHTTTIDLSISISSISARTDVYTSSIETPLANVAFGSQNNVSIINTLRELQSGIRTFLKVNYLLAYKSIHATGAYLDASMDLDDTIAYVTTTEKFKPFGKLLIGDEIVSYTVKQNDRFLYLTRGLDGTTIKIHPAGEFLRQYGDDVSIISAGVSDAKSFVELQSITGGVIQTSISIVETLQIEVESNIITVKDEIQETLQLSTNTNSVVSGKIINSLVIDVSCNVTISENNITKCIERTTSTGISDIKVASIQSSITSVERFYKAGVLDYYTESLFLNDDIVQRNQNTVTLSDPINLVITRINNDIFVRNESYSQNILAQSYSLGNIGNTMGTINDWYFIDGGTSNVSALTFNEIENFYSAFTIQDFTERSNSAISYSKSYWQLAYPSIQNPIAIVNATVDTSTSTFSIPTTQDLDYFPSSGYLYIGHSTENFGVLYAGRWAVVSYTSKVGTTFTGCSLINRRQQSGDGIILQNAKIIPYSI